MAASPQPGDQSEHPPALRPPAPPEPDDPYKPFVTAGQISGPKTPPAHRQQELWNTVFGENYEAIDEYDDEEEGRPVWLYALGGSVLVGLIAALVWAFTAGPLSSPSDAEPAKPSAEPSASAVAVKPQSRFPALPKFEGTPSPVNGAVTDRTARIALPRLGGRWRTDTDTQAVQARYGFTTRQYVPGGDDTAQLMSGPLPQPLADTYTTPDKLGPVVNAVALHARRNLLPKGNRATKIAQQQLSRGGMTGMLSAYRITAGGEETTVAVAALNTGGDLPAIVYMAVPASQADLLPDINRVFRSIRPISR